MNKHVVTGGSKGEGGRGFRPKLIDKKALEQLFFQKCLEVYAINGNFAARDSNHVNLNSTAPLTTAMSIMCR